MSGKGTKNLVIKLVFSSLFLLGAFQNSTSFAGGDREQHGHGKPSEAHAEGHDDDHGGHGGEEHAKESVVDHVVDHHRWVLIKGKVELDLPVILWRNGGLEVFSTAEFREHGTEISEHGHTYYHLEERNLKMDSHDKHIKPIIGEKNFLDFSITQNTLAMFISVAIMLIVFLSVAKGYKKRPGQAPKGIQSFFEPIIQFIRDDIAKENIGPKYKRYMPYLLTLFFFIWFNNLLGLLPGAANVTGNIGVTFILALITLLITIFSGNKNYWKHIFATPGVPVALLPIMIPVEIIGIFTKPFSLMIRLFANITAGHILILSLLGLTFMFKSYGVGAASVAFSVVMNMLELFVALLQAYIFTLLSAMYFGTAVEDHH